MSNQTTSAGESRARRAPGSGRSTASANGVVDLHRRLLETAFDLTLEFDELPAGSVMRCFARAVHLARMKGVAGAQLPEEARRIARVSLRDRAGASTRRRRALATLPATA